MIETTYRRYGLSLDARLDTRHSSDPDCRDPEIEPVEIVDYFDLFEEIGCNDARWDSFVRWLKTPAVAKEFAEWVDAEFRDELLEGARES